MRYLTALLALSVACAAAAQSAIDNDIVTITPTGTDGRWTGFRVARGPAEIATVRLGSTENIVARKADVGEREGARWLRLTGLSARPTPALGPKSYVEVRLRPSDPYPEVWFRLDLGAFSEEAWEKAQGRVPFHFLACSVPGAEVFHQRGWPIATPVIDEYPLHEAEGPGQQIGAYPTPVVGLWNASDKRYIAYDFHHARLSDNSEKYIASAYCYTHAPPAGGKLDQFFVLAYPYGGTGYRTLLYPEEPVTIASHFTLLWDLNLASDDDPNLFVNEFSRSRYASLLPPAPERNDLSWLPGDLRPSSFRAPRLGRLYPPNGDDPRWMRAGSITISGVGYDPNSAIDYAYEHGDAAAIEQLRQDLEFVLQHARRFNIEGDECVFWEKPTVGEGAAMFGPGVRTLHNVQGWGAGLALLDTYRNDPGREDLLPYIDGVLRYTKHILYTRNGYADVPAAEFAWGAAPAATFCLRYYYTFRDAPERAELADLALKLARTMTYRYLAIWTSDNDKMDDVDASFFMEPNAGVNWLGAACSNEVWVVAFALGEVTVATGDPILRRYLRGMLERWHELYRDARAPSIRAYRSGDQTERYGLFDGALQGRFQRGDFGGIWGGFEALCWPIGGAQARVICGERGAMAYNRDGLLTDISDYRCGKGPNFGLILRTEAPGPVDIVVTFPFFDLRNQPVRAGKGADLRLLAQGEDYLTYDARPDSIYIRGVGDGMTIEVGTPPTEAQRIDTSVPKPLALPNALEVEWEGFAMCNLAQTANELVRRDWEDPRSYAGLEPGPKWLFGVPFEIVPPQLNEGRAAVRGRKVTIDRPARRAFFLVSDGGQDSRLIVTYASGRRQEADLAEAIPAIRGWPPLFEWHIDLVSLKTNGERIASVEPRGLTLFAVTTTEQPDDRLAETIAALKARAEQVAAERATIQAIKSLGPLFEAFSGHIAVIPTPDATPRGNPVVRLIEKAGLAEQVRLLSPQELVDPAVFNAANVWVALMPGGENYYQTVSTEGDADAALIRYLGQGGTLVVMPSGPFPFYYNEKGEPVVSAPKFGLPICGSGAGDRADRLQGTSTAAWETPPEGRRLTFELAKGQQVVTSLPRRFPWPTDGDQRWRPIVNVVSEEDVYAPILALRDQDGHSYGDAAALIEYHEGPLSGGRVLYVWDTLTADPRYQSALVGDVMRYVLENTLPPPARTSCVHTASPPRIDGLLDDPVWQRAARITGFMCFGPRKGPAPLATTAMTAWDERNLYVAFVAQEPDIIGTYTQRDGPLWEEDVCEVYVDSAGNGRDYREFEVNPINTVIDLLIPFAKNGGPGAPWQECAEWNAAGWRTATHVEGTPDDRKDVDREWTVEMAIPLADLAPASALPPKVGDAWRVQLFRIARARQLGDEPMFAAWSPTQAFHDPSRFGYLTFGADPRDDDFSLYPQGSDGAPTWRIEQGSWRVDNGTYIGRNSGSDGWIAAGAEAGDASWTDYCFTARFRVLERGSDHRDGPWFGFRHAGEDSSYSLNFGATAVSLHRASAGTSTGDEDAMAQAAWHADHEWHSVAITVRGSRISASLDGSPLFDAVDEGDNGAPPLDAGGIVLSARRWSQSEGNTTVAFDDVKVEPLP
jgi:hypothetical protein